ncbi:MAG: hypothetical protein KAI99_11780 [Cyclobacteriaceae bacterium]|nr:hypothetical protein [Cyclobacteriaceae bacterium]MCK5469189.1 hypothetical protein [Cyclobacteriaceae bacterium]
MSKKKKSWLAGELTYIFLAPFLVLIGILGYGILFDKWYKDPILILEYSGIAYGVMLGLRLISWSIRSLSR